jgi:hypothetical protein
MKPSRTPLAEGAEMRAPMDWAGLIASPEFRAALDNAVEDRGILDTMFAPPDIDPIRAEALRVAMESLRPHGDTHIILARAREFEAYLRGGASGSGQPSDGNAGDGAA